MEHANTHQHRQAHDGTKAAPPASEPTVSEGDRSKSAAWIVGEPNAAGWSTKVSLDVGYHKGYGYQAALRATDVKRGNGFVSEAFTFATPSVLIGHRDGSRFHRGTLRQFFDTALAQVRALHADANVEVIAMFARTPDTTS
jgi:hypothetical protein